jgi:AraC-like DNA-binding protein
VALETMRNTYLELPNMSEAAAQGAGELIKQLVRLSLMELAGQETAQTQREALRDRIRAYVQQHLRDPALSIDSIARPALQQAPPVQRLLGDGETLAGYIQHLRLEACIRDLQRPARMRAPITDIALSWGFGNPLALQPGVPRPHGRRVRASSGVWHSWSWPTAHTCSTHPSPFAAEPSSTRRWCATGRPMQRWLKAPIRFP